MVIFFVFLQLNMIEEQYYSLDIPLIAWILLGGMVIYMAIIGFIMWPKLRRVRHRVTDDDESPLPAEGYPPVSVIVYSQASGYNLRVLLPQILQQDYPSQFEVIVVNDETDDDTENIVSELELYYPNLYMTFAPERSRSLSRRKLSLTLGIKAARFDTLLFTDGSCRLTSPNWMRRMMRHLVAGAEIVLGYAELRGDEDGATLDRTLSFDRTWEATRWISSAICHKPVRGTACNLAYIKRLFFERKGFSNTLNLKYGDDDIFINEIANDANTAIELSDESRVVLVEASPNRVADLERLRRDFTARKLPRRPYISMGTTSLMWWLWAACAIAASILGLPSLIPATIAFVLATTFSFIAMTQWKRTAIALGNRPLFLTEPWLAWARPLRTLVYKIRGARMKRDNLTHII